jgi:hypothetical protein
MDFVAYFNLDMTGYLAEGSDIHVNLMYTSQDSLLGQYVKHFSRVYFPEMPIWQDWLAWGDSDYSSFNRNGYPAIHPFEDVNASSPFIHSRQDILGLSVNNLEQSKRFTELNLGTVALLAGLNGTALPENATSNVSLYPNPANDAVRILSDEGLRQVTIYNLLGQEILRFNLQGQHSTNIDINNYISGVYIVKVETENGQFSKRLVVR